MHHSLTTATSSFSQSASPHSPRMFGQAGGHNSPRRRRTRPLAWLFAALALLCFAPAQASAQTTFPDTLDLGTVQGIRLNLIYRMTTADGKTYYFLDHDENGRGRAGVQGGLDWDYVNHNMLAPLLNGGADTIATQEGGGAFGINDGDDTTPTQAGAHNGVDDERSVIVGEWTLILPTEAEALVLVTDQSFIDTVPGGEFNDVNSVRTLISGAMLTADLGIVGVGSEAANAGLSVGGPNPGHHTIALFDGSRTIPYPQAESDNIPRFAFFEVQPALVSRLNTVNETIMAEAARAITDTTVNAITQRLEQAGATGHTPGAFTLAGQSTLADILTTGGKALANGTLDLRDMLGRSAFVMPLNTGSDMAKSLTLWGGGDYREIGGSGGGTDWDGSMFSARLGADARLSDTLLTGAAISWTSGDFDYGTLADSSTSGGGNSTLEMTSIAPYVGWSVLPGGRLNLWATVGYGRGEVGITDIVAQNTRGIDDMQTSDATLMLAGGGVSARVLDSEMGHLRLKGEVMQTSMEVEGQKFIHEMTVEARRARFSVAAGNDLDIGNGAQLTPAIEVGLRHDEGNDGRTGTGAEVGGGVTYTDPHNRLTAATQGRYLLGHNGGYDDWGIGAIFSLNPAPSGQGLALRLTPTYGQTVTNTAQLWNQNAATLSGTNAAALGRRMDAEVGYGLALADGQSLLTPYGNMTWGQRTRAYRMGSRLTLASGLNLSLESQRGETPGAAVNHGVLVNVEWGW